MVYVFGLKIKFSGTVSWCTCLDGLVITLTQGLLGPLLMKLMGDSGILTGRQLATSVNR